MQFPARHQLIIYMPQKNTITTDVVFVINGFIIIIIIISIIIIIIIIITIIWSTQS